MTSRVRYRHFLNDNRRVVATIATLDNPDGTISVAVARRSPKDTPNRKIGRTVAEGRLKRYMEFKSGELSSSHKEHTEEMHTRGFTFDVTKEVLASMFKDNPFVRSKQYPTCPYGVEKEEDS